MTVGKRSYTSKYIPPQQTSHTNYHPTHAPNWHTWTLESTNVQSHYAQTNSNFNHGHLLHTLEPKTSITKTNNTPNYAKMNHTNT